MKPPNNEEHVRLLQEFEADDSSVRIFQPHSAHRKPIWSWKPHVLVHSFQRHLSLRPRHWLMLLLGLCVLIAGLFISLSLCLVILDPPYTTPPLRYERLSEEASGSTVPGRANINNEKIFIAANIIDGDLIKGAWGGALRQLVDLLGPENTFVSIFENDSGPETIEALTQLGQSLSCNRSIVTGAHLDLESMPKVELPNGARGVKRIEYMAQIRNLALKPLEQSSIDPRDVGEGFRFAEETFDRVLFLNDVYFNAIDAAQLLFSTKVEDGVPRYEAACAVDFVSTTNFYDAYATRDFDGSGLGYGPGFRIFPWFSREGSGLSRRETLKGNDAVPVQSCWGGMVAFRAHWFQRQEDHPTIRFRSINEPFWDASECCLIHADLSAQLLRQEPDRADFGVYMNPYVRVAYESRTFSRIPSVARLEHGLCILQDVLTKLSRYPLISERVHDIPGQQVVQKQWQFEENSSSSDNGTYHKETVIAEPGGFCGLRDMVIMKPNFQDARESGEGPFDVYAVPGNLYRPF